MPMTDDVAFGYAPNSTANPADDFVYRRAGQNLQRRLDDLREAKLRDGPPVRPEPAETEASAAKGPRHHVECLRDRTIHCSSKVLGLVAAKGSLSDLYAFRVSAVAVNGFSEPEGKSGQYSRSQAGCRPDQQPCIVDTMPTPRCCRARSWVLPFPLRSTNALAFFGGHNNLGQKSTRFSRSSILFSMNIGYPSIIKFGR